MKHTITILALLLVPSSAFANPPDLCAEDVYRDATGDPVTDSNGVMLSRYCQWAGPDAPVWDGEVCCAIDDDGAACSAPGKDRCAAELEPFYCKHGEEIAGGVVCYQSFPSACELGFCSPALLPPEDSQESVICCTDPGCYPWADKNPEDCPGLYTYCYDGYSKVDGTVECFD
jgi:hypothetical protein